MIFVIPFETQENEYIELFKNIFNKIGIKSEEFSLFKLFRNAYQNNYIFLNWFENQSRNHGLLGLFLIFVFMILVKVLGYRVFYVKHNIVSHNLNSAYSIKINKLSIKIISLLSDVTFCHGKSYSKNNKLVYLPHPLYTRQQPISEEIISKDGLLVFGRMQKYKEIVELLSVISPDIKVSLWGKFDEAYYDECQSIINRRNLLNVNVLNDFIPTEKLNEKIRSSQAVLVTNPGNTSIISGSIIHAFTLETKVITRSTSLFEEIGIKNSNSFFCINSWSEINDIMMYYTSPFDQSISSHFRDEKIINILTKYLK
ncbi:hypothetical protein AN395_01916 [Pseudoalteromonas sp. P1-30]|uniref:glycosyltransferase n=1 Tax=Pseudoalteromonas sp. P1-30 TaxID=1723760 RepID=UPI0006D62C4A|nr:glycosyltransferase [Pseudoalteromonas sp. P1-30]KPV91511.1 hypothetical protein AN395_01916 [Pseudoalteromonas sp. P1-30]